jgi:hypothetical protein
MRRFIRIPNSTIAITQKGGVFAIPSSSTDGLPFSVTERIWCDQSGVQFLEPGTKSVPPKRNRSQFRQKRDASGWFLFVRTPCPSLYPELLPTGTLRSGFRFLHRSVTLESATDVYVTTATHYSLESINREDFRMQLAHVRWDSREQRKEREVKQTSTR